MNDLSKKINITEISRLTNKTRPSIYKYVNEYTSGLYKDIPHSFVLLFDKISSDEDMDEIIKFCDLNFKVISSNDKVNDIILTLKNNYKKLDLEKIHEFIKENINE